MEGDLRRIETRVDRLEEHRSRQDSDMSALGQRVNGIERDVGVLGSVRDNVIRLQAQWENFVSSDLPELNAKLDKVSGTQEQDRKDRVVEREEARKDRRNTLIALLSIAVLLLAAFIPILAAGVH